MPVDKTTAPPYGAPMADVDFHALGRKGGQQTKHYSPAEKRRRRARACANLKRWRAQQKPKLSAKRRRQLRDAQRRRRERLALAA